MIPVPISQCPHPELLSGLATLTTITITAAPSAAVSCLIFLPGPDKIEGLGSSCLAQQPPFPCKLELPRLVVQSPGSVNRQAGFHPMLQSLRAGDLGKLCGLSNPSVSSSYNKDR